MKFTSEDDLYEAFHEQKMTGPPKEKGAAKDDGTEYYDNPADEVDTGEASTGDEVTTELANDECPEGGDFGVDIDKFGQKCTDCPNWDNCMDENERLDGSSSEEESAEELKKKAEEAKKEARREARRKKQQSTQSTDDPPPAGRSTGRRAVKK